MAHEFRSFAIDDDVVAVHYVEESTPRHWKMAELIVPRAIVEDDLRDIIDSLETIVTKAYEDPGPDQLVGPPDKLTRVLADMTGRSPEDLQAELAERLQEDEV